MDNGEGGAGEGGAGEGAVNVLEGRIVQTTYLGEIAHHHVEAAGQTDLRVAELNPDPRLLRAESPRVRVWVSSGDVVVLREG